MPSKHYLHFQEQTITNFSDDSVNSFYNNGFVFTRISKGGMQQTRSLRINLEKFELSSENKRILRKNEAININSHPLPYQNYNWTIGKLGKDFYTTKFGDGTFSANKIKELFTDPDKSNFNRVLIYSIENQAVGYCICYETNQILHYSYPFYQLNDNHQLPPNLGLGMMLKAILSAKDQGKKYIYLGSASRPTDTYKLQFTGLEWFDGKGWKTDLEELKNILSEKQNIQIRPANYSDLSAITQLFYDTITTINTKDYNSNQIAIWSSTRSNLTMWQERLQTQQFFVAEINNAIVGFSSLGENGYLDFMYVHKDYQGQGIASALLNKIIDMAKTQRVTELTTEASITAKPFFEKRGFEVVKQQTKTVKETEFVNYLMKKIL